MNSSQQVSPSCLGRWGRRFACHLLARLRTRCTMIGGMPASIVIFFSTGFLVYWVARTRTLLSGSALQIAATLENDVWLGRRVWLCLRMLGSPDQLVP